MIAKAPAPGRSKTRLCPPCTHVEAARLARAALEDTLGAVAAAPASRRVVALEGRPGPWLPPGFEVVPQRGRGLDERLAAAFEDVGGQAFLVAMDTPQVTAAMLGSALAGLEETDAVLGPTRDGGYWGIGLRRPRRAALVGVPMSSNSTCEAQAQRLRQLALTTRVLETLTDVDSIAEAREVALAAPRTRFAQALRASGHAADDQEPVAEAVA